MEDLSRHLLTFWPSQDDMDIILQSPTSIAVLLQGVVCQPYEGYFSKHLSSSPRLLQKPAPGTHPVLIARSMLLLVTLLHSLPRGTGGVIPGLSVSQQEISDRLFNAATRLVTSNEDIMDSVEGLECILLEAMYLCNLGNLRRAWLANRRGLGIAQMMGIHTGRSTPSMVFLDQKTIGRVRIDYMWFRFISSDRHLSLLLGLPQATPDNIFATPEVLETLNPMERFERISVVACSLILQRNISGHNDLETTYQIDKTLQRAATLLPSDWWGTSPLDASVGAAADDSAFRETLRLINQFIYHHLLLQLHLPYMLLPPMDDPRYDCSKMTVANASRSILARFVSFHRASATAAYCRCIDFIAFIASTTLCLAHIEARRQHHLGHNQKHNFSLLQPLLHQRPGDRGLLERMLEIVNEMNAANGDSMAKRIGSILSPLLEIEQNSYRGGCYSVAAADRRSTDGKLQSVADFGDPSNAPHVLCIKIPYFGTIRIEHHSKASAMKSPPKRAQGELDSSATSENRNKSFYTPSETPSRESQDNGDWYNTGLQTPSTERAISTLPVSDWQTSQAEQPDAVPVNMKLPIWDDDLTLFDGRVVNEPYLLMPGLSPNPEEWALQGEDVALFQNLRQEPVPVTSSH